jgi:outer membrane biosynthesis protein TonB
MARSVVSASLVFALALTACGGSQPEAEAPAGAAPATVDAPPAPAGDSASDEKPAGGGWEGEAEATEAGAPAGEKVPPKAADSGVAETRTMEVIQKIVKDQRQAVRDCYEKARKELPSLQGDLVIHFTLDPEGKVKAIEVNQQRTTLKAPAVSDCAIKTIKGLTFPPSSRGMETEVNYPYNFKP